MFECKFCGTPRRKYSSQCPGCGVFYRKAPGRGGQHFEDDPPEVYEEYDPSPISEETPSFYEDIKNNTDEELDF